MNKQDPFEEALKQAYSRSKRPVTEKQLTQFKQACAQRKRRVTWPTIQWGLACSGLLFLSIQLFLFTTEYQQPTLHTLNLAHYDQLEVHSLQQGLYQRDVITQKAALDKQLALSQQQKRSHDYHGELVKQQDNAWLIADCKRNTLITLEKSLLQQLVPNWQNQPSQVGRYLTLNSNASGEITSLTGIGKGQQSYSCP